MRSDKFLTLTLAALLALALAACADDSTPDTAGESTTTGAGATSGTGTAGESSSTISGATSGTGTADSSSSSSSTSGATSGTSDTSGEANACAYPLVRLQTGKDPACAGDGNEHRWPVGMPASACHGWRALDTMGKEHNNSANDLKCNADGSFSFTQFAGNLDCTGNGVTKTYALDDCEQDIPPVLYTRAVDLTCCSAPESAECLIGTPSVSIEGATIYLDGAVCAP